MLGVAAPLFVCSQFYRVANAVVAPRLQRDLGLSSAALGSLSAAFFYAFAAAQIPVALFLDRVGARRCMTVLSLVGAAGAVTFAAAEGEAGATVGRVLLGIGMAANLMGSLKLIAQWFSPREFATLAGVLATLGTLGNILATTPLALLVEAVGWRRSFVLIAVGTVALTALFWMVARDRPAATALEPDELPSLRQMLRRLLASRDFWLISLGTFCRYGTFLAIQGLWAGPYLVEVAGLSPVQAANLILLLNVALIAGSPLGGWLSDRVLASRKKIALIALAGTAAAQLALATSRGGDRWLLALVLIFLGLTSSFGQVVYAHIKEVMPPQMAGMAMTGVNLFTMLGAAAFLHGMGWLVDHASGAAGRGPDGYRAAFLAGASATAIAFVGYLFTRDAPVALRARR